MPDSLEVMERTAVDLTRATPRGLRPAQAQPQAASSWFWNAWGDVALPGITEGVVLGLPAAWRCVQLISNGVAAMAPPRVLGPDGVTALDGSFPVVSRPSPAYGVTEFWAMAVAHMLTSGNFVGVLADPDTFGWPRQVVPIPTAAVDGHYTADGYAEYTIGGRDFGPSEVVHVRWHCLPGQLMGIGAVTAFRRALGGAADQQNYSTNTWRTGAVPSGIIHVARPEITAGQAEDVQEQWITAHGAGQRRPAVLPEMFTFTPISWSPEDAQFLGSRQFSVAEVALMFGLDPGDLGASIGGSGTLTYANLTDRLTGRVVEAYGPHAARFEDAWSDLLPGGNLARFRRANLTHASRKALFEEQAIGIAAGVLTVDEARAEHNLAPLPDPDPPDDDDQVADDTPVELQEDDPDA